MKSTKKSPRPQQQQETSPGTILLKLLSKHGLESYNTQKSYGVDEIVGEVFRKVKTTERAAFENVLRLLIEAGENSEILESTNFATNSIKFLLSSLTPLADEQTEQLLFQALSIVLRVQQLPETISDFVLETLSQLLSKNSSSLLLAPCLALALTGRIKPLPQGQLRQNLQSILFNSLSEHYKKLKDTKANSITNIIKSITGVLSSISELISSSGKSIQQQKQQQQQQQQQQQHNFTSELISEIVAILFFKCNDELYWHVKRSCLNCLQSITTASPQVLYPFWPQLIPFQSSNKPQNHTVFSLLLNDKEPKVRISSADFLCSIITASKPYMVAVTPPPSTAQTTRRASFTAFTHTLGSTLISIHSTLLTSLETNSPTPAICLPSILKCLSVLVSSAPFDKLGNQLLVDALMKVLPHIQSREMQIRSSALDCTANIISAQPPSQNMASYLESGKVVERILDGFSYRDSSNVHVEALRTIGAVSKFYSEISFNWETALKKLEGVLRDPETPVRIAVIKLFDDATSVSQSKYRSVLWQFLIPDALSRACQDNAMTMRAAAIGILSNLEETEINRNFPKQKLEWCKKIVISMTNDQSAPVRASAWKTIGTFVSFPSITTNDSKWVSDVVNLAIETLQNDTVLAVRVKAIWALSNAASCSKDWTTSQNLTAEKVAECFVKCCKDHEKVRANAIRGIGNLAVSEPFLLVYDNQNNSPKKKIIEQIALELFSALKSNEQPKTQWNACKATGILLSERSLIGTEIARIGFENLIQLVTSSKNYKIRIHSSQALTSLISRDMYNSDGNQSFCSVWSAIINALDKTRDSSSEDFASFKYKDSLCSALVSAVSKLSIVANSATDYQKMSETLSPKAFSIVQSFKEVIKHAEQTGETLVITEAKNGLSCLRQILESDPLLLLNGDNLQIVKAIDSTLNPQ